MLLIMGIGVVHVIFMGDREGIGKDSLTMTCSGQFQGK